MLGRCNQPECQAQEAGDENKRFHDDGREDFFAKVQRKGKNYDRRARDQINVVGVIGNAPQRIVLLTKNKICNHGHCEKNGQGKKGFVRAKRQMPAFVLKGTEFESVENANQTERDYCHTQKNIQKINGLLVQQITSFSNAVL